MRFQIFLRAKNKALLPFSYHGLLKASILNVIKQDAPEFYNRIVPSKFYQMFNFSPLLGESTSSELGISLSGDISFLVNTPSQSYGAVFFGCFSGISQFNIGSAEFDVLDVKEVRPPKFSEIMYWTRTFHSCILTIGNDGKCLMPDVPEITSTLVSAFHRTCDIVAQSDPTVLQNLDITLDWLQQQPIKFEFQPGFKKRRFALHRVLFAWQCDFILHAHPKIQELMYYTGFGSGVSDGFGVCNPNFKKSLHL